MDIYNSLKGEILQINKDMSSMFLNAKSMPGMSDYSFGDWQKTCDSILKQISDEIIRVAVVGPIKSGKSTFVNSVLKGDYLKRGAGVVTSIVTRIRRGEALKAKIFFKFWDEVNADMEQAMVLFPSLSWRSESERFEIRRHKERMALQKAIDALSTELLITNDTHNINSVLLSSYLKGYEKVNEIISSNNLTMQYDKDRFAEHRLFVGDDTLSVYLKDIELEIDCSNIGNNIEIADCQGSDSPNPLHLARIQDYLLLTHFIIYVISSRTGLRQADIRFLSMIKKMGIMDNILFIINCDFSEHASMEDLNSLIEKVKEELSLIKPDPEVFALSSLFNLFMEQNKHLPEKDRSRLAQWKKERSMAAFSDQETERFESSFKNKLIRERYALLLKNHLERLDIITSGVDHWVHINQDILCRDTDSAKEIINKIRHNQERMGQIKSMIRNTLDGAVQKIKYELKTDIDRFFDVRSGDVLGDTIGFIRNYTVSYYDYKENLEAAGFANTLFMVFQEVKQAIDNFMAEVINPEIVRFIREKEKSIKEFLESIAGPYDSMVKEALAESNTTLVSFGGSSGGSFGGSFGITADQEKELSIKLQDVESIKGIMSLKLPPSDIIMRYSAKIKTEAILRFGFYSVVRVFKKILKKSVQYEKEEEIQALKDGVKRMKRETEKSIISHFKDYRENIKFQYVFKLVEAASNSLYDSLLERFQAYATDFSKIVELVNKKKIDKQQASEFLKEMEIASRGVGERIKGAREQIEDW